MNTKPVCLLAALCAIAPAWATTSIVDAASGNRITYDPTSLRTEAIGRSGVYMDLTVEGDRFGPVRHSLWVNCERKLFIYQDETKAFVHSGYFDRGEALPLPEALASQACEKAGTLTRTKPSGMAAGQ